MVADGAAKQRNGLIQDAFDCTYGLKEKDEQQYKLWFCQCWWRSVCAESLKQKAIYTVSGTMKLHAVSRNWMGVSHRD